MAKQSAAQTNTARRIQRLSPVALIAVLILIACLVPIGFFGWHIWQARSTALEQGFVQAENLALSLSQHAARTFSGPEFVLSDALEHLANDGTGPAALARLTNVLVGHVRSTPVIREIGVLDERGYWMVSSLEAKPTHSNGDRDYFIHHRDNPDLGLRINAPLLSRITGQWTILLTRRFNHPDSSFAGIVLAAISMDYFQRFYDTLNVGEKGQITLFRDDGRLLVRRPYDAASFSLDVRPLFLERVADGLSGRLYAPSPYDGVVRLGGWRRIDDFPLVIVAGLSEDDVLSAWRKSAELDIAIALAASGIVIILGSMSLALLRRRDHAERVAAEAARQYELIAAAASDIIVRATPDGRRLYISPACRDMMGYEPSELIGVTLHDLAHPDDIVLLDRTLEALRGGVDRATLVYRGRHRNGHYVWLEVAFRMVCDPDTGIAQELIASTRDISSRKIGELQLARAKEAAELASRAKSNFLSGMSHELRTPLNAIIGFSDLMNRQLFGPIGNERYAGYVADIKSSGEHLLQLINDILDHAKIEAGQLELHEDVVDLSGSVAFVMHMLALQAEQAGLSVSTSIPAGIRLLGDERRIRQILLNLLSNAIKYTPSGGRVTIAAAFADGDLVLSVADTGIGIAEADRVLLLQPFTQIDNERNRTQQGTGLGLTLTRQLAELHGGRLALESRLGQGTTVFVYMPASRILARPA